MEEESDEVRKREKMRVVGTQKGPGSSRQGLLQALDHGELTVEVWNASEDLRNVVLRWDERLPAPREDRHRVHIKVTRVCRAA